MKMEGAGRLVHILNACDERDTCDPVPPRQPAPGWELPQKVLYFIPALLYLLVDELSSYPITFEPELPRVPAQP